MTLSLALSAIVTIFVVPCWWYLMNDACHRLSARLGNVRDECSAKMLTNIILSPEMTDSGIIRQHAWNRKNHGYSSSLSKFVSVRQNSSRFVTVILIIRRSCVYRSWVDSWHVFGWCLRKHNAADFKSCPRQSIFPSWAAFPSIILERGWSGMHLEAPELHRGSCIQLHRQIMLHSWLWGS